MSIFDYVRREVLLVCRKSLRQAFEKHGAPLIIRHDGDIFSEEKVRNLLDEHCVIDLKSPPSYLPYNRKGERPRPLLGGKTSRKVFKSKCVTFPDPRKLCEEVKLMESTFASNSCSRRQKEDAGRKATEKVVLRYGVMKEITDMSIYLETKTGTC